MNRSNKNEADFSIYFEAIRSEGQPTLSQLEMAYIQFVLSKHYGDKKQASVELGVALKTLYNKLNASARHA